MAELIADEVEVRLTAQAAYGRVTGRIRVRVRGWGGCRGR
jgi:hypothetical protein